MTISTSHKGANQLKEQLSKLQLQVNQLQEELNTKRHFLAHIAHELRTPLNTIIGFAQILDRQSTLSDTENEYLKLIMTSSDHLLSLINDILQMSKLEAGSISLAETDFDLFEVIKAIDSIYRAEASEKKLEFQLRVAKDTPRYIIGDSSKIRQILSNLLSNAIKFTNSGSVILTIFTQQTNDDENQLQLVFSVTDTGQGIREDERERLFVPYQQTSTGEKSDQGTGIGLVITKQLIDLMDGNLQVDSEWGTGSTFTATIQVGYVGHQSGFTSEPRVVNLALGAETYRILAVDDSYENRTLLRKNLTNAGFEVTTAENGQQAINIYKTWQPHLILMDLRMPILNGYEATQRIRSDNSEIIIFAITASAFEREKDAAMLTGCDDYIKSPFCISSLLRKIGHHLNLPAQYDSCNYQPQQKKTSLESELESLSPELMRQLGVVASSYSIGRVQNLIDDLPPNLANYIDECLDEFDFDAIISLCGGTKVS